MWASVLAARDTTNMAAARKIALPRKTALPRKIAQTVYTVFPQHSLVPHIVPAAADPADQHGGGVGGHRPKWRMLTDIAIVQSLKYISPVLDPYKYIHAW